MNNQQIENHMKEVSEAWVNAGVTVRAVKSRPILFSTPMVQAILEERKTMTRRTKGLEIMNDENPDDFEYWIFWDGHAKFVEKHNATNEYYEKCPYGQPGDVFWVREKFAARDCDTSIHKVTIEYAASEGEKHYIFPKKSMRIIPKPLNTVGKYQPSIHMPKDACRIRLMIKSVGVERLQDISEQDAIDEGVNWIMKFGPKRAFKKLWQSINGIESWEANPWVWVIEFEKL